MAKFRHGFVSNSSSSSFVLVVMRREHEQIMTKLSDFERAVINFAMKEEKLSGTPVMMYHELTIMDDGSIFGAYSFFSYDGEHTDGNGDYIAPWEVVSKYKALAHGAISSTLDD